jgi:hypothetical protein
VAFYAHFGEAMPLHFPTTHAHLSISGHPAENEDILQAILT